MRNIHLDALEIFHAVATEGGIVRAAEKLHRVQSNVTTRIKQLEERLGVSLFLRQGRRLALSAEGQLLMGYAERLLRLSDEAEAALRAGRPLGSFRLGSLESTAGSRLPPILSRYNKLHPGVRIELATGTTNSLVTRVMNFDLEAAFVSEPFTAPGLEALPVFEEELVLISARSHPPIEDAASLGRCTLIAFANGCSYRKRLEDWLGKSNLMPERVLEFASYQAIVACVAAGTGVAILPRSLLAALRASGEVRIHPLPPRITKNRTHLIWQPGHESLALRSLIHLLRTEDKPRPAAQARKPAAVAA
ncbi:MAG: LysR substrate-binding domain-containing protein [Candidatus Protistobacter heckmanni]|nr:LysR substrate-binding domain-containing protein [Candidatus Protistobacter heckmanni]